MKTNVVTSPIVIEEREAHFYYDGNDVVCDTTMPTVWRKCQKQGWSVEAQTLFDGNVVGMILRAPKRALSIRGATTSKRKLTDEQRIAAAERLRKAREKKNG